MSITVTKERGVLVQETLRTLLRMSEGRAVFLCNRGGSILDHECLVPVKHADNVIALAAGSFFATLEMARLLGEDEFEDIIHHGRNMSVALQRMPNDLLLVVVFNRKANPGMVKFHIKRAANSLSALMQNPGPNGVATPDTNFEIDETRPVFIREQ